MMFRATLWLGLSAFAFSATAQGALIDADAIETIEVIVEDTSISTTDEGSGDQTAVDETYFEILDESGDTTEIVIEEVIDEEGEFADLVEFGFGEVLVDDGIYYSVADYPSVGQVDADLILVQETAVEETPVDEIAVDEIAVDRPVVDNLAIDGEIYVADSLCGGCEMQNVVPMTVGGPMVQRATFPESDDRETAISIQNQDNMCNYAPFSALALCVSWAAAN